MLNSINSHTYNSNINRSNICNRNNFTCTGYLNKPVLSNSSEVSFQGISSFRKFFEPKYLDPAKIPQLVDTFTDKVISLHTSQKLTLKSLKKLIKQVAPDQKIIVSNVPEKLKPYIDKSGMTESSKTFGFRFSKIYIPYSVFKKSNLLKSLEDINILTHEFTHALQFHTKDFERFETYDERSGLDRQLLNDVNESIENSIFTDEFLKRYKKTNDDSLFTNVVNNIFIDNNINNKQDKINVIKFLYSKMKFESQAYYYGNKSMAKLTNINTLQDITSTMLSDLAEYIKLSLEKQGIDTSDLLFKDLKNL